jgi:hypothetical protein
MKRGVLGIMTASMLIGAASMMPGPADAQPSQTGVAPKKGAAPPTGVPKQEPSGAQSRFSSEESKLPIPSDIPKAQRVDPGK